MRARIASVLLALSALAGCVSVGIGNEPAATAHLQLHDDAPTPARLGAPLVGALLIQPLPADALADTLSIAYARRANEFGFYQLAVWTERPVRQLPRLLEQRLEARGVAGAVGQLGEPLRADWLLTIAIDTLHHDVAVAPGLGRFVLTAELFDRRSRTRIARRQFAASVPSERADSAAGARAMSQAVTQVFDTLLPWLEAELPRPRAASPN